MSSVNSSTSVANGVNVTNGNTLRNGTTTTSSTSPAPKDSFASKAKKASSAWRNLDDALKDVSEHSAVFFKIAEAMDQHNAMKTEVQKKDKRIADLESGFQTQNEELGKSYIRWDEDKSRLEHQVRKFEVDMNAKAQEASEKRKAAHTREVGEMRKELEAEKNKVARQTEELERANAKTKRAEIELSRCTAQLREWEGYVSSLKDVDFKAFRGKVKQLFTRCCKIARTYFFRDLPAKFFADSQWENLSRFLDVPLDFPPSNSLPAKHIRMAACLHLLARRLCTDFFKPCYVPESAAAGETIKEILIQQSLDNVGRERLTRALLLSTYEPEDVDATITQAACIISKDVLALLSPMGGDEAFRKEVEAFFREAAEVWKEAQQSKKMVLASMRDEFNDWQWSHLEEFTVAEIKAQPSLPRFDMLNLFPRIWVPEDGHVLNPGFVLWPHQNTVFAAEQELRERMAAKRPSGNAFGGAMRRERRLSTLQTPTSLGAGDKVSSLDTTRGQPQGIHAQNRNSGGG